MKSFYPESTYDVPVTIVRVLLFVITLISFLPKSVSALDAITYTLQSTVSPCPGCDTTHTDQGLYLSGPVPVGANTIKSITSGSIAHYCVTAYTGSTDTYEYADASAYANIGNMGLSVSVDVSESPALITEGNYQPCYQYYNPTRASAYSYAQVGFQDVLHATFPGVPDGTPIRYRFTKVWAALLATDYPDAAISTLFIEIWDPGAIKPYQRAYYARETPDPVRDVHSFEVELQTGASYIANSTATAAADVEIGWTYVTSTAQVWIPDASSSVTAMSTFAYYVDVLTPGASYYTDNGTIYPTSDSVHLDINRTGAGSGSVKSSPAGIDCGLTCSAHFLPGTAVVLTAIPAADSSIFSGWSGDPACTDDSVFMTTTKSCTPTFDLCLGTTRSQIGSTNYDSISLAYGGAATNGDTIKVLASNQQEGALAFSSGKSVALTGGYDCSFSNIVSYTVVTGSITISAGDVTIGNIVIL